MPCGLFLFYIFHLCVSRKAIFRWIPSFFQNSTGHWASLVAQIIKHLPTMRETWVQFLGQEYPLEKEMATDSNTLAWKIPQMEEPGGLQPMGSQRVGHDWATSLALQAMSNYYNTLKVLWPPDEKSWLIGKDPDAGKDWRRGEGEWQRMRWLDGITESKDMSLSKF